MRSHIGSIPAQKATSQVAVRHACKARLHFLVTRFWSELEVEVVEVLRDRSKVQVIVDSKGVGLFSASWAPHRIVRMRANINHNEFVLLMEDRTGFWSPNVKSPRQLSNEAALTARSAAEARGGSASTIAIASAATILHRLSRGYGEVVRTFDKST